MIFLDTCSLLKKTKDLFDEPFIISSITLDELENIKTSNNKDPEIKFAARQTLRRLDECPQNYTVEIFKSSMLEPFIEADLEITNDIKILSTAFNYKEKVDKDLIFITDDLALKNIAKMFFDNVKSISDKEDEDYTGYSDVFMNEECMAEFYSNLDKNLLGLNINEYVNIRDSSGTLVDTYVWTEEGYRPLRYSNFESKWFGKIKPMKGDIHQAIAFDSLMNNQFTLLRGPAGSGKSLLALGYLFHLLDKGRIDKIVIFCNTVATKDSARLGFYPGTRDEKILESSVGNFLSSKLGDKIEVERLIDEQKIVLLPLADCRGFDTSGMQCGVYITEAQNFSIDLMKLALQRIGEDSICILDGDFYAQVDQSAYAGNNNGLRRASEVFRGQDFYGEVELKTIHRSKIGLIADKM